MLIKNTIELFLSAFGRNGIDTGNAKIQLKHLDVAELELQGELKDFYSYFQFDKLIIGGELFMEIFPLKKLLVAQKGWRFVTNFKGEIITEDAEYWDKDWIVFGDRNGDAIFCKINLSNASIFGSIQKTKNLLLADSLSAFLLILHDCMIMEQNEFKFNTQTDDFAPKTDFINAVLQIVNKYSDPTRSHEFIQFFFG